ncbi:MAG TPA: methylmalonyl-CoA epimerase [Pseudonocardiaceae bacterium]|jgi:methylmalonyl-CoA/ethylmalonyl-CoA epimerase|nr:methylmalonyl-CoA epimerase [Pseudonocardiaceae bacterium]
MTDGLGLFVTAIDHVGVAVPDLDEAVAYYRDTFGFEVTHLENNEDQGVREAMLSPHGAPPGSTVIQLLAPLNEDSTIAKFLRTRGAGMQQLAYRVRDLDAASAALRAKGVRLIFPEARHGTANSRTNFVHPKDAGGVLIELVEPAPENAGASEHAHPAHETV